MIFDFPSNMQTHTQNDVRILVCDKRKSDIVLSHTFASISIEFSLRPLLVPAGAIFASERSPRLFSTREKKQLTSKPLVVVDDGCGGNSGGDNSSCRRQRMGAFMFRCR